MIPKRTEERRLQGLTVLVVEDHPDSRELVSQLLSHEGAFVMAAHDGLAALQLLKTKTPDLILADLRMPGMDGLTLARRMKSDARWRSVPSSRSPRWGVWQTYTRLLRPDSQPTF